MNVLTARGLACAQVRRGREPFSQHLCFAREVDHIRKLDALKKKGTIITLSKKPGEYWPVDAVCSRYVSYNQCMGRFTFFFFFLC